MGRLARIVSGTFRVLPCLGFAACLLAGADSWTKADEPPPADLVVVRVLREGDRSPVAGATVCGWDLLRRRVLAVATTNADGVARLADAGRRLSQVEVRGATIGRRVFLVVPGAATWDLLAPPARVLCGRVTDARDDAPLPGARVRLVDVESGLSTRPSWSGARRDVEVRTGPDGGFAFPGEALRPGSRYRPVRHALEVSAPGHATRLVLVTDAVRLLSGELAVPLPPSATVRGRVTVDGASAAGAVVRLAPGALLKENILPPEVLSLWAYPGDPPPPEALLDAAWTREVVADAEGRFVADFLPRGHAWSVQAHSRDGRISRVAFVRDAAMSAAVMLALGAATRLVVYVPPREGGAGIEGAQVFLSPNQDEPDGPPGRDAVTDEDGQAAFDGLPAGSGKVAVRARGYASGTVAYGLAAGTTKTVEVLLAREDAPPRPIADVGGTLVDDEGRPLADVEVAAGSVDPVRTDDAGRFVLHGVHPGLVRVRVEGPPGDSERLERTVWAPVEDVRLVVPRPATLVVRVRAEEGRVPGGWLELQGPGVISGRWRATVRTTFRTVGTGLCEMTVDVEPTVATVRLEADGFLPLAWPVTAAPGERIELPVRVLRRSLALEGRVLDPWGRPQNEALVEVRERDERAAQGLRPYRPVAETDEAGRFRIEGLAPGEIVLRAEALDLVSPDRTVTVSDAHQPVDLRLPPVARVRGRVLDRRGDPVGGAVVRLAAPDDERAATPPTRTTSDVAGRFVVLVPAGRYRLWSGDDPMPKASPDAHVVTLAERDDVEVRLVANP